MQRSPPEELLEEWLHDTIAQLKARENPEEVRRGEQVLLDTLA